MIHPTAIIDPKAQLDSSVQVGPYAIIEAGVTLGPDCIVGPHVHLLGQTVIGARNRFHTGCVIGDWPQDLKYKGEPTGLRIGDDNVFREGSTVHRSAKVGEETIVGSHLYLMATAHIGHNALVGDHVIIANATALAGHTVVQDRAFVSATCLIHQFTRVGTLALMQGGACISKDLPPFCVARGNNGICGLNSVGLRRAGFTSEQRIELKRLYHLLFRSGEKLRVALNTASMEFTSEPARQMIEFVASARRGVLSDTRKIADEE
jgi:UDP-N-acetylglucosamine acyltransferase